LAIPKRRQSGNLPTRLASSSVGEVVDLQPGHDGVWEVPGGRSAPVARGRRDAAATALAVGKSVVLTTGDSCVLCKRKAEARMTVGFLEVKLCKKCKNMGVQVFELLRG
jgi:hypothetical protein